MSFIRKFYPSKEWKIRDNSDGNYMKLADTKKERVNRADNIERERRSTRRWFITILLALVAIVGSFFVGKSVVYEGDYAELKNEYNQYKLNNQIIEGSIVTQGQNGDNTVINEEKPPRHLDEDLKLELIRIINNYIVERIDIYTWAGDAEAYEFGQEIVTYLQEKDYNARIISGIPHGGKPESLSHRFNEGVLTFYVGSQE